MRDRLPLYVGGDLDAEALGDVRAHLALCEGCARAAREALRAREVFRSTLSVGAREILRPSPELWVGVRAALVAEGRLGDRSAVRGSNHPSRARGPARPGLRLLRYAGGLAAAAAVTVFALVGDVDSGAPGAIRGVADTPTPTVVVGNPLPAAEGGLRRVRPDEARPLEGAQEVELRSSGAMTPFVLPTQNALAGDRRASGRAARFR